MKLKISNDLPRFSAFLYSQAARAIARSYNAYQPVAINGVCLSKGERVHSERWAVIEQVIRETESRTVLDLGCAEGYFVERAASQCGCFALGVDADMRRLSLAQASVVLNHVHGAGYMYADLTPEFIGALPSYDTIIFMSVLHHIMYEHGITCATDYMRRLRTKASKGIIFEMGQSDEVENAWARLLPDMGSKPHDWIADFLRSAGFSKVTQLCASDAYRGSQRRAVFHLVP